MARWKLGPQGAYFDQNDTGPDQVRPGESGRPLEGQTPQDMQQGGQMQLKTDFTPSPNGLWDHAGDINLPGIPGGQMPWSERAPDGNGGYFNPGGHFDASGQQLPSRQPFQTGGLLPKPQINVAGGPMDALIHKQPAPTGLLGSVLNQPLTSNYAQGAGGALGTLLRSPFGVKR